MREIKFQAIIETPDGKVDKYPCGVFDGKVIISTTIPYYGQAYVSLTSEYGELIGLRQYTGLKDKNGQEIFEGDIIKGLFYESLSKTYKTTICYVAWDISGYWTYKGEQDFIGGYLTDLKDVEVIGNMYENPELIDT